jgi:thiol-disulfide isomerase/thioredoxin
MRRAIWFAAVLSLMPVSLTLAGVPAPRVLVRSLAALPTPLPFPYDEKASAEAAVNAAFERAKKSGKRVLVDFGGNWCPDCRILAGVMDLPAVKSFVETHYEVAAVDVGYFNRNLPVVNRMGVQKLRGVPTVVIADAAGCLVNVTNSAELANVRAMTPQGIADWLARWAEPVRPPR